jgi:hypothetical protein
MTPPATLLGAKCRWATLSGDERPEKVNEKVIVPCWIVISKAPVPAVLIGGTSFSPLRLAEKRSVCELATGVASRFAITAAIAQNPIFLVFIILFVAFLGLGNTQKCVRMRCSLSLTQCDESD